MEKKQNVTITALCSGCPSQFAEYLAYCRSLKFEAKPNIAYLRGMFRDLFRSQGYTNTNSALDFDWTRVDNQGPAKTLGAPDKDKDENNDVEMITDRKNEEQKRPDTAAAVRSERAKRASCSNTHRGNHAAYTNCTNCDRQASRRVA